MSDISRRGFIKLSSLASAGVLVGCATNPVSGRRELMLMSEQQEIAMDRQHSPHQFSADYGAVQDTALNGYISACGNVLARASHRPQMPYSFRVVNANYINAYTFPAGSVAVTRGILLDIENESQLAGLLGHEIGHVAARHTGQRMSKQLITSLVVAGVSAVIAIDNEELAPLAAGLGGIGAGMLLAGYSRDNEREADALGMDYMVAGGYNPDGMPGLMQILVASSRHSPSAIERMFATHPMSDERLHTAQQSSAGDFAAARSRNLGRERYMDNTVSLRRIAPAIRSMQSGEQALRKSDFAQAETHFRSALKTAPNDYCGLLLMAKCQLAQEKYQEAAAYTAQARRVYAQEPQALHLSGIALTRQQKYDAAYREFAAYEELLPGNPNTIFYKGYTQEGLQHRDAAAQEYTRFLKVQNQGDMAQHAYQRLVEWGYIKPQAAEAE